MAAKKPGAWDVVSTAPVSAGDGWNVVSTTPIAARKPIDTHGVNISAAPSPSVYDRFRRVVANSAAGHAVESALPKVADALNLHPTTAYGPEYDRQGEQLIAPEAAVPGNPTSTAGQIGKGVLKGVGQMTSAPALATGAGIAVTGGLAEGVPVAAGLIRAGSAGAGVGQAFKQLYDAYKLKQQGAPTGDAVEAAGAAIPGVAAAVPAAGELLKGAGKGAQTAAEDLVTKGIVGARVKDTRRGANPGKGYFEGDPVSSRVPSLSMKGIANRAGAAKAVTGQALNKAYKAADANGTLIPAAEVRQALQSTVGGAKTAMQEPGGAGDIDGLSRFEATFEPALQAAEQKGGFTPSELWKIRRNIDDHVAWTDATKAGMKQVQQRTSGALGGLLEKHVPETAPLNQAYQNQVALYGRAAERAATGQNPLSEIGRKVVVGGIGSAAGAELHGGPMGALGGAAALAADSVPVKTTAAALLHGGGELAEGAGKIAQKVPDAVAESLAGAAAAPKKEEDDLKVTQTGPNTYQGPTVELASGDSTHAGSMPTVGSGGEAAGHDKPDQVAKPDSEPSDQTVDQETPQPEAELYTPETHQFSPAAWLAANPGGNHEDARAEAERLGYEIVA